MPYPDPSTGSPAVEVRVSAEGPVVRRRDGRRSARSARSSGTRFAFGNADPSLVAFGDRVTRDDRTRSVTGDRNRTIREPNRRSHSQPSTNRAENERYVIRRFETAGRAPLGRYRPTNGVALTESAHCRPSLRPGGSDRCDLLSTGEFERTTASRVPAGPPEPCVGGRCTVDKSHTTILNRSTDAVDPGQPWSSLLVEIA